MPLPPLSDGKSVSRRGLGRRPRVTQRTQRTFPGWGTVQRPSFHAVLFLQMEWGSIMILGMLLSTWAIAHTGEAAPAALGRGSDTKSVSRQNPLWSLSCADQENLHLDCRDLLSGKCETQARMRQNIPAKLLLENTSVSLTVLA